MSEHTNNTIELPPAISFPGLGTLSALVAEMLLNGTAVYDDYFMARSGSKWPLERCIHHLRKLNWPIKTVEVVHGRRVCRAYRLESADLALMVSGRRLASDLIGYTLAQGVRLVQLLDARERRRANGRNCNAA